MRPSLGSLTGIALAFSKPLDNGSMLLPSPWRKLTGSMEVMEEMGSGFCAEGYYDGWDSSIATVDACKQKCLDEPQCLFAALYPGYTCSRYDSLAGTCESRVTWGSGPYHTTYRKITVDATVTPTVLPTVSPAPTVPAPTTQSPTRPTPRPTLSPRPTPQPTINNVMTDSNIRTAVAAWLSHSASAEATYGHISTWETGGVTDMSELFW